MVEHGGARRTYVRVALLVVALTSACGGRSVSETRREGDDQGPGGNSGGTEPTGGVVTGGTGFGDDGSSTGGSFGGATTTGGIGAGGSEPMGGSGSGGTGTV